MAIITNIYLHVSSHHCQGHYLKKKIKNLNQNSYLEMRNTFFLPELDEENLEYRKKAYCQQDGCPAHSTIQVCSWLNKRYKEKWIGRYGPICWPAGSHDLSPLDFFFWGFLKEIVYKQPIEHNTDLLKTRIISSNGRKTGSVKDVKRTGRPKSATSEEKALNALLTIEETPQVSTREVADNLEISHDT
ncbi:hypothetical protein NQ318_010115 [Aromia moschata]|uniref:Transposase n=1 Tax=Aromia moschata TaxID=1265417 RepID=A0AAV8Y9H4_9CUCU|nr:hypothetical protein NQ318_010115 [Aromia moschata]